MARPPEIVASIAGRTVDRDQVLRWEDQRLSKLMRRLALGTAAQGIAARRQALADHKLTLGHQRIRSLLRHELGLTGAGVGALARLSAGRRQFSTIELAVDAGSAENFIAWWNKYVVTSSEPPLLEICPDHWIIRPGPHGWQEVVETTGGSPLASQLFIDYHDVGSLQSTHDHRYDHQVTAAARRHAGAPIGGLRHQLRNTPTGFEMSLTAEFPALTPRHLVNGHRWHLACEFSNMIERSLS